MDLNVNSPVESLNPADDSRAWRWALYVAGGLLAVRVLAYLTWSDAERREWRRNVRESWKEGCPSI